MAESLLKRKESFLTKDKISLINKSSNSMTKNLQKEISEIKDEVSNSEFILKAKNQRIKELKIKLNNLNLTYENLYNKILKNTSLETNDNDFFSPKSNNILNKSDLKKDTSIELNITSLSRNNNNYNTNSFLKDTNNLSNILDLSNHNIQVSDKNNEKKLFVKNSKNENLYGLIFGNIMEESEKTVNIKKEIEENIKNFQILIDKKEKELDIIISDYDLLENKNKSNLDEYSNLKLDIIRNNKKYKNILNFLENHEIFIKKFEGEMLMIRNRIEINKNIYEKLEKEMIIKLYFIRFL